MDEPDEVPNDLERFIKLCEEGDLYEHLADLWLMDVSDRDALKEEIFRTLLFGRVACDCQKKYGRWLEFTAEYPTVAGYLKSMKFGAGNNNHGVVAWVCQRVESWLMIERICGPIKDEIPGVAIATVHDAILVGRPYAAAVESIMREEFAIVGLNPTIRSK